MLLFVFSCQSSTIKSLQLLRFCTISVNKFADPDQHPTQLGHLPNYPLAPPLRKDIIYLVSDYCETYS